jgi:hypothetical protein
MPLDTGWISWAILVTVLVWLGITQKLRVRISQRKPAAEAVAAEEFD